MKLKNTESAQLCNIYYIYKLQNINIIANDIKKICFRIFDKL